MNAINKIWLKENIGERDISDSSSTKYSKNIKELESTVEYISALAHLIESKENFKTIDNNHSINR